MKRLTSFALQCLAIALLVRTVRLAVALMALAGSWHVLKLNTKTP